MADKRKFFSSSTVKSTSTSSSSYHHYSTHSSSTSTTSSTSSINRPVPITYRSSSITTDSVPSTARYQPVYDRTRQLSAGNFNRTSTAYKSLPSALAKSTFLAAGESLLSPPSRTSASTALLNYEKTSSPFRSSVSSTFSDAKPSGVNSTNTTKPATSYGSSSVSPRLTSSATNPAERYSLDKGKAYVYIFNFPKFKDSRIQVREGSEQDVYLLKNFFSKYRVKEFKIYEDLTLDKIKKKMSEVSKKRFLDCSCVIIVIMSHGNTQDRIQAYDQMFNLEMEVVEKVLMNETLKGKPKLFFVQACKGEGYMEADFHPTATNKNDIYKCFGTYEGTLSFRDRNKGTYFIQSLFPMIESNGDKDIAEIMTQLRNEFSSKKFNQAPTDTSTLTKKFYFKDLKS